MKDFRSIKVWKRAHDLTLRIYRETALFPDKERFGLTAQIRRACSSIPTNIAEGCGRNGEAELRRFMEIATGSASEVEYQLLLAHDLQCMSADVYSELSNEVVEVRRMLSAFAKTLRAGC